MFLSLGGVVGTVYGKRTSELGIADIGPTYVTVSTNINGFTYVAPSDGCLHVTSENPSHLGVTDGDGAFLWLLRPATFNAALSIYLKKGQSVYISHENSKDKVANIVAKFKPI